MDSLLLDAYRCFPRPLQPRRDFKYTQIIPWELHRVHLLSPSHFKCFSRQAMHAVQEGFSWSGVVALLGEGYFGESIDTPFPYGNLPQLLEIWGGSSIEMHSIKKERLQFGLIMRIVMALLHKNLDAPRQPPLISGPMSAGDILMSRRSSGDQRLRRSPGSKRINWCCKIQLWRGFGCITFSANIAEDHLVADDIAAK